MLTPQREAFAAALAQGMTQAAAYRAAYPRSLKWKDASVWQRASVLAATAEVQSRVTELVQKAAGANEVTVERVVKEFARLAFVDVRKMSRPDGTPVPLHELDEDTARAIVGVEVVTQGNAEVGFGQVTKYRLADKRASLADLGRFLKMFVDRVEVSGQIGIADVLREAKAKRKGGNEG